MPRRSGFRAARQFVVDGAVNAFDGRAARDDEAQSKLQSTLARIDREIENLLRAIEAGAAPDALPLKRTA